jgi:5-methylcytosine-specific restriction endonuclease McrA
MIPANERPWREWYQLEIWRRRRRLQLREFPLCAMCLERGVTTPATVADHVESHGGDWNKFRLGRLQSLCKPCHDRGKRLLEIDGCVQDIDHDGWPTDPRHPANKQR